MWVLRSHIDTKFHTLYNCKKLDELKGLIKNINLSDRPIFILESEKSLNELLFGEKALVISQETIDKLISAMLTNAVASSRKDLTPDLILKVYEEISDKISKK